MDAQRIAAVLEIKGVLDGVCRQFAWFTYQRDPSTESVSKRCRPNKTACFRAGDEVNVRITKAFGQHIDCEGKCGSVRQQRSNVFEDDARLGEVRDVPNMTVEDR